MEKYNSINEVFNIRLQQQIDGVLPQRFVYELGMPSEALLYAGVENLPIEMSASTLTKKSDNDYISNHPFELSEIKNLPLAIQCPIAVFDSEERNGKKVVLTEIVQNGNNFIAILDIIKLRGRNANVINSIISLYAKESNGRIAKWFDSEFAKLTPKGGTALLQWADTKKASNWLTNHVSDVRAVGMSSRRIANIINSFADCQFFEENSLQGEDEHTTENKANSLLLAKAKLKAKMARLKLMEIVSVDGVGTKKTIP